MLSREEGNDHKADEQTSVHPKTQRKHHFTERHMDRAQSARRRKALSMPNVEVDFEHDVTFLPIRRRRAIVSDLATKICYLTNLYIGLEKL